MEIIGEPANAKKRKDPNNTAAPTAAECSGGQDSTNATEPGASSKMRRKTSVRTSWEQRIAMLTAYKEENGNLLIPIRYKKNPSLGKFVHNTREQYKLFHKRCEEGFRKKCSLTKERIDELDKLGFVWSTQRTKKQNEDWQRRLEQLESYKEKHGVRFVE